MNTNAVQGPVNFFMAGGRYISDTLNLKMIDTSQPNAFEEYDMTTVMPDMMENYIQSEGAMPEANNSGGMVDKLVNFFTPAQSTGENAG